MMCSFASPKLNSQQMISYLSRNLASMGFPLDLAGPISKALLWCRGWLRGFGAPFSRSSPAYLTGSDITDPVVLACMCLIGLSAILLSSPAPTRAPPKRVETPTTDGSSDESGPGMQRVRLGRGRFVPDPTTDSGPRPRRKTSAKLAVVDMAARRSPIKSGELVPLATHQDMKHRLRCHPEPASDSTRRKARRDETAGIYDGKLSPSAKRFRVGKKFRIAAFGVACLGTALSRLQGLGSVKEDVDLVPSPIFDVMRDTLIKHASLIQPDMTEVRTTSGADSATVSLKQVLAEMDLLSSDGSLGFSSKHLVPLRGGDLDKGAISKLCLDLERHYGRFQAGVKKAAATFADLDVGLFEAGSYYWTNIGGVYVDWVDMDLGYIAFRCRPSPEESADGSPTWPLPERHRSCSRDAIEKMYTGMHLFNATVLVEAERNLGSFLSQAAAALDRLAAIEAVSERLARGTGVSLVVKRAEKGKISRFNFDDRRTIHSASLPHDLRHLERTVLAPLLDRLTKAYLKMRDEVNPQMRQLRAMLRDMTSHPVPLVVFDTHGKVVGARGGPPVDGVWMLSANDSDASPRGITVYYLPSVPRIREILRDIRAELRIITEKTKVRVESLRTDPTEPTEPTDPTHS